jgi:hypothetical protein
MTERCAALAAFFVVAAAGNSDAGTPLTTSHLLIDANQYIRCVVTNTSAKEVVIEKIESVDALGTASMQRDTFTLAPGATEANIFVFTSARCVFSLKKRKLVRAYGCVSNLAAALCLTKSEAR